MSTASSKENPAPSDVAVAEASASQSAVVEHPKADADAVAKAEDHIIPPAIQPLQLSDEPSDAAPHTVPELIPPVYITGWRLYAIISGYATRAPFLRPPWLIPEPPDCACRSSCPRLRPPSLARHLSPLPTLYTGLNSGIGSSPRICLLTLVSLHLKSSPCSLCCRRLTLARISHHIRQVQ